MPLNGWPPESGSMPDLSHLSQKLTLRLAALLLAGKYRMSNPVLYALVMSYARLMDKAMADYTQMRASFTEYLEGPGELISPLLIATSHGETLITTMMRIIKIGRRIRNTPDAPPIDKRFPVFTDAVAQRLNKIRCAIEHIDGELTGGGWIGEGPALLALQADRLSLSGQEITYTELAVWLEDLHGLAKGLLEPRPASV